MKRSDINRILDNVPSWEGAGEAERMEFAFAMQDVRYGDAETHDAFEWFHLGYSAGLFATLRTESLSSLT